MTAPYYADQNVTLHLGDNLAVLPTIADASVDAVVCDPPYELGFMGNAWDASGIAYNVDVWRQCWRVLKPGGHLLAFGGTRTYHRMACAIEDAGFEIRDSIHWIYGSGFPKGQDIGKAIDRAAGATREIVGASPFASRKPRGTWTGEVFGDEPQHGEGPSITAPATPAAEQWDGWNTQLKPAHEPIVLARKSTGFDSTVANVLRHGTGALNIEACRTPAGQDHRDKCASVVGIASPRNGGTGGEQAGAREDSAHPAGRWPTNLLLTHQPLLDDEGQIIGDACADGCMPGCPIAELDQQSGSTGSNSRANKGGNLGYRGGSPQSRGWESGDSGGASRFFPVFRYEAKAPASERPRLADGTAHPTVKPLALMRWLVRLVTPPGGLVLDPFAGSGTTLEACVIEGFTSIGIEEDQRHADLCITRLAKPLALDLFGGGAA